VVDERKSADWMCAKTCVTLVPPHSSKTNNVAIGFCLPVELTNWRQWVIVRSNWIEHCAHTHNVPETSLKTIKFGKFGFQLVSIIDVDYITVIF
jgi:hypothetical protein